MTEEPDFDRYLSREEQQQAAREANLQAAVFIHEERRPFAAAVKLCYDALRCKAVLAKGAVPEMQTLQASLEQLRSENLSLRRQLAEQTALAEQYRCSADRVQALETQLAALTEALSASRSSAASADSLRMENEHLRRETELHLQTIRTQSAQIRRLRLQALQQKTAPKESEEA